MDVQEPLNPTSENQNHPTRLDRATQMRQDLTDGLGTIAPNHHPSRNRWARNLGFPESRRRSCDLVEQKHSREIDRDAETQRLRSVAAVDRTAETITAVIL